MVVSGGLETSKVFSKEFFLAQLVSAKKWSKLLILISHVLLAMFSQKSCLIKTGDMKMYGVKFLILFF